MGDNHRAASVSAARRVLVSGDEFHASLALVRALRAGGFLPVLAITLSNTYASRSRAVEAVIAVPHAEDEPEAFADAVARAADQLGVAAILPGTEASLIALARRRGTLAVPIGAPAPEIVERATNKATVLKIAAECGLHSPTSIIARPSQLAQRAHEIAYPAVLKPLRTRLELDDSRLAYYTARRVDSAASLCASLVELPQADWVVQPYLPGTLAAVAGVAWEGRLMCAVHQASLRIWPPDVGYSSSAETVEPDATLESKLARLLRALEWSGLFQAQFIRDSEREPLLIDFNPRAYGSLALAVRSGANLPALWASLVLGVPAPAMRARPGTRYRLEHNDVRAIVRAASNGDLRAALAGLRPHARTAHAIFSLRDPGPLLTTAEKLLARRRDG